MPRWPHRACFPICLTVADGEPCDGDILANLPSRGIFARIILRDALSVVEALLDRYAAVGLLGPRQLGKTTLVLAVAAARPAVYLDLESSADRAKLAEPKLYLAAHAGELFILDKIHQAPDLFAVKRSLAPKVEKGFHLACADLAPRRNGVIYPGTERFALGAGAGVEAMGLDAAIAGLVGAG